MLSIPLPCARTPDLIRSSKILAELFKPPASATVKSSTNLADHSGAASGSGDRLHLGPDAVAARNATLNAAFDAASAALTGPAVFTALQPLVPAAAGPLLHTPPVGLEIMKAFVAGLAAIFGGFKLMGLRPLHLNLKTSVLGSAPYKDHLYTRHTKHSGEAVTFSKGTCLGIYLRNK